MDEKDNTGQSPLSKSSIQIHALLTALCSVILQLRPMLSVLSGLANFFKDKSLTMFHFNISSLNIWEKKKKNNP